MGRRPGIPTGQSPHYLCFHPFFTGEERILDIEGRVDKFKARAAAGQAAKDKRAAAAQKQSKRAQAKIEKAEAAAENTKKTK